MSTMDSAAGVRPVSESKRPSRIEPSSRFDWWVVAFLSVFMFGTYLDAWAHLHLADELETFFTPWHAVLYSGFILSAGFHVWTLWRNVSAGAPFGKAMPLGYQLSLLGVIGFAVGGVGDMFWHQTFGTEAGLEALVSPTHILLITSSMLLFSGPFRSAYQRKMNATSWSEMGPAVISMTLVLSLMSVVGNGVGIMGSPWLIVGSYPPEISETINMYTFATAIIGTLMWSGVILFAVRRWGALPVGAVTVITALNVALVTFSRWQDVQPYIEYVPAILGAAVAADVLLRLLKPSRENVRGFRIFATLLPFIYLAFLFFGLMPVHGTRWEIHVWLGMPFMVGAIGFLASLVFIPPPTPDEGA